jgi:hypothetical protein
MSTLHPRSALLLALLLGGCGSNTSGTGTDPLDGAPADGDLDAPIDTGVDATPIDANVPEVPACDPAKLDRDPFNCGTCGTVCEYPNADGLCVAGECKQGDCLPGYHDFDPSAAGCEYFCWPTDPPTEICDGVDNDCNGTVDDGFALATDPNHCGSCEVACKSTNGTPACVAGKCALGACADRYRDLDKIGANGCEYFCPVWPPQAETCNGLDDDCNGAIDDGVAGLGVSCDESCPAPDPCVAAGTCKYTTSTCVGRCCGVCTAGETICAGGAGSCAGGAQPKVEICNGADDNCDGQIDEGFDLQIDPNHCGSCAGKCDLPNAIAGCGAGKCKVVACKAGYGNVDGNDDNGCEYPCPAVPPRAESCNGVDDDCNGVIDDPAAVAPLKPAATGCQPKPGTPCAGVDYVCKGTKGWRCDYPSGVEVDASGKLAIAEARCDGIDGNCNGQIDESFPDVGGACDNGLLGACRDAGKRACDPADPTGTICDLSIAPDPVPGAPMAETCNGVDDDCNGAVDDGIVPDMVLVTYGGSSKVKVDRYEASRPDATSTSQGLDGSHVCTRANVLPWTRVTQAVAAAACAADGRRLCTAAELQAACEGGLAYVYPYGSAYQPLTCNGIDFDGIPGGANDDVLVPTGSAALAACVGPLGIYDLSGNAAEWTSTVTGNTGAPQNLSIFMTKGGSYATPQLGLTCQFGLSRYASNAIQADLGFRCCKDAP